MSRASFRLAVFAAAVFAIAGPGVAIPPDQPPLEQSTSTPNFNYLMRTGLSGTPHNMGGAMFAAGSALDRNGTSSLGNPLGYHAGYVNRGLPGAVFHGIVRRGVLGLR